MFVSMLKQVVVGNSVFKTCSKLDLDYDYLVLTLSSSEIHIEYSDER